MPTVCSVGTDCSCSPLLVACSAVGSDIGNEFEEWMWIARNEAKERNNSKAPLIYGGERGIPHSITASMTAPHVDAGLELNLA